MQVGLKARPPLHVLACSPTELKAVDIITCIDSPQCHKDVYLNNLMYTIYFFNDLSALQVDSDQ